MLLMDKKATYFTITLHEFKREHTDDSLSTGTSNVYRNYD